MSFVSRAIGICVFLCPYFLIQSQDTAVTKMIAAQVQLDSVVIVATRQGFNVEDFIRLVQTDESLYRAFHNLRIATYHFETSMAFTDKRDEAKATYHSTNLQTSDGTCRSMKTLSEDATGDFYKGRKQKKRYYTYELYDRLFVTHGIVCETRSDTPAESDGSMERQVDELKKLIFRPGERSQVPFIGRKTEIFSDDMIELYDLTISSGEYEGRPSYIFTAKVKERYADRENKTVFKELTTYFLKEDFQVIARNYRLSQNTALYEFDVTMQVDLTRRNDQYFPTKVVYDGEWNVPTKKKESGTFTILLDQFQ